MSEIKLKVIKPSVNNLTVRVFVRAVGLPFSEQDVFGKTRDAEFLARNPNGTIPLIDDDGFTLWESNAIVRYLAAKYGADSLYPDDLQQRADADRWMDWQLSTFNPVIVPLFFATIRTPPEKRDPEVIQAALEQTVKAWQIVEAELAQYRYLGGEEFSLGDIPLGVWAAVRKDSYVDHLVRFFRLIGYSVPIFWLGLMGLLVFYAKLDWLPGPGRLDFGYEELVTPVTGLMTVDTLIAGDVDLFRNALGHLILPASLLGYFSLAYISRMTRSLMLGQLRQEYILTARVKGVPERRIIWKHAMGNIMVGLKAKRIPREEAERIADQHPPRPRHAS